jgi:hypothetical protein
VDSFWSLRDKDDARNHTNPTLDNFFGDRVSKTKDPRPKTKD